MNSKMLISEPEDGYELLDSGDGEKLERYGSVVVLRPDPQALWKKELPESEWQKAHAAFVADGKKGIWKMQSDVPKQWNISLGGFAFKIRLSSFKHTGLFPEQKPNWAWISEKVKTRTGAKILNLFGYTGGATLTALQAGAEVVHVDGSKVAVTSARENAELSGLGEKPVRWIVDDAAAFVEREARRGNTYDGIIMDPPAFGRGPEGELWKIEEHFLPLLENCKKILTPDPLFVLVNGYASGYSAVAYKNTLDSVFNNFSANAESDFGELLISSSRSKHLLPAGIFARISRK